MRRFRDRLRLLSARLKLFPSRGPKNSFSGTELARFDRGENLEDWSRQRLGARAYECVMRRIMDFLYAVPLRELSTPFPEAIIQQADKLGQFVPPEGMGEVSEWLIESIPGDRTHLSSAAERLELRGKNWTVLPRVSPKSTTLLLSRPKHLSRPSCWKAASAKMRTTGG